MPEFIPRNASLEWASLFAAEWTRLAGGRADHEFLIDQGLTLVRVVGDRPAADVARQHFENTPEPEQLVRDFEADFTALAAELGIIQPGDRLDAAHIAFAHGVAELCAAVGEGYGDSACTHAGRHIKALYGPI
ncbi:hypothetical protein M2165_003940 [Variovorax sp. TBS-050B]|uniref:hypothetical protein n=1 Tax=Variovorax sp. TBS-050B TaxID=2940551 RepID=UPI0024742EDA|nr:hypothetical protein [Variovorax sp. TBS-050B]MDH6594051.1 hypothetical protein [Variovorax sp. TBS-050B]